MTPGKGLRFSATKMDHPWSPGAVNSPDDVFDIVFGRVLAATREDCGIPLEASAPDSTDDSGWALRGDE